MNHFADRLFAAVKQKRSQVVVGLDPDVALIPEALFPKQRSGESARSRAAQGVLRFLREIVPAVADVAVAVKPQLAYFERLGPAGISAYEAIVEEARRHGLLVIVDGKRNDVSQTALQYSRAYLGPGDSGTAGDLPGANEAAQAKGIAPALVQAVDEEGPKGDALTVNAYMGRDSLQPFVAEADFGRGIFVLVKTSNPSSGDVQDRIVRQSEPGQDEQSSATVAQMIGAWLEAWNEARLGESGYGPVGAVVGATYPQQLAQLRQHMPHTPFLIPGFGAQGGQAADVAGGFDEQGLGAVVNASRSILYAYRKYDGLPFAEAARRAALTMRDELRRVTNV